MGIHGTYMMVQTEMANRMKEEGLSVYDLMDEEADLDEVDLEKDWDALQYVMEQFVCQGMDPVLEKMVLGGSEIGDAEEGAYGAARWITEEEVKQISGIIQEISEEAFRRELDLEKMEEAYVNVAPDEEEYFDGIWSCFQDAREFFRDAAAKGLCIIFFLE